jgi:uncharacterized cupredoxin-like copper-binding protein
MAAGLAIAIPSAVLAHGSSQGETAFGRPGDGGKPSRVMEIVMRDADGKMRFEPSAIKVKQGEQVRFRIRNEGLLEHEFILATHSENMKHADEMKKNPEMEHDEPNMKRIKPNETKEVLWRFTKAGKLHIGCLIPGHLEAGMEAYITVTESKAK